MKWNFGPFFSKCTFLRLWHWFSCLVLIQSTQFSVVVHIYEIHVLDGVFFLLTIRMVTATKLFKVVTYHKELPPIILHDTSMGWSCEFTWQIKHIRSMGIKLGKMLTHCERLSPLKSHDSLITWPIWSYETIWKMFISTSTKVMATKLGRMLT